METVLKVNAPKVVCEIIDGEAIMMNLATGNYFSAADTGRLIWSWVEQGVSLRAINEHLAARFDVAEATLTAAVDSFIADLRVNALIVEVELPPGQIEAEPVPAGRAAFVPPVLTVYTDMQDLLLLDPIDDVDEAGWPTAPQTVPGTATRATP